MKPAEIYRRTGRIYTRINSHIQFENGDANACENAWRINFAGTNDLNTVAEEWPAVQQTWLARYHFSVQRANVLRPFVDFFPQKEILEIGSGCGSVTRFLGECEANVIALEENFGQANLTAERC